MRFQLDQNQFNKFRKNLLIKTIPLLLMPGIVVVVFNSADMTTVMFIIPLLLTIIAFVMQNAVKKQKKAWETYELIIDDTEVKRNQEGFPSISVAKTDIVEAVETSNGTITLIAKPKTSSIIVPFSVYNKSELMEVLSTFTTIRKSEKNYGLLRTYGAGILGIGLFFLLMLSTNIYLTLASGLILLTICLWSFIETQRNKNVDKKVKRASFITIIMVVVIVSKLFTAISQYFG